jgi:hypothetical protein
MAPFLKRMLIVQRGRKSADSMLSVVVSLPGQVPGVRPDPPDDLPPDQAETWRVTVERMPADWFTPELFPLLRQLCRHVSYSEAVGRKLELLREWLNGVEGTVDEGARARDRFDDLTKIHEREGRAISSLMTRLRLTPHSRYAARGAHTAAQSVSMPRPWETD